MSKDIITVNMNIYDIPILVEELEKADKEIERLNNIIDKQDRDITTLTKDKIKLKNIINELKKYLIEMSDKSWDDNGAYDDVLDKLYELKGDNK